MNDDTKNKSLVNLVYVITDMLSAAKDIDRLLEEATESGMESGRILGLVEAHEFLTKNGHTKAANSFKKYLELIYPPRPKA
jgi:hypothetical protein